MKQTFETPKVQVVRFEAADIIVTSGSPPTFTASKDEIQEYEVIPK